MYYMHLGDMSRVHDYSMENTQKNKIHCFRYKETAEIKLSMNDEGIRGGNEDQISYYEQTL